MGSRIILLSLLLLSGCDLRSATPAHPGPEEVRSLPIWVGKTQDLYLVLHWREADPKVREFYSPRDSALLGAPEEKSLFRLEIGNISSSDPVQVPMKISSTDGHLEGLGPTPPSTPRGRLLWRALGGGRKKQSLEPGQWISLNLLGPMAKPELKSIQFGQEIISLKERAVPLPALHEFRRKPSLKTLDSLLTPNG